MVFKKYVFKRPRVSKTFKEFDVVVKNRSALKRMVTSKKSLKKVFKKVFSYKGLKVAGITTIVGLGVHHVMDYIQSNSGCFLKGPADSVCKVRAFSCCQKEPVHGVPFCDTSPSFMDTACDGFDEDQEKSCCRLCDCQNFNCLPNQTMECQRPTVGEALTHFGQNVAKGVWSTLTTLFPWLSYLVMALAGFFFLWIASLTFKWYKSR